MPASASVFRRGGPKKELFEVLNEETDDSKELEGKLKELDELLHMEKSGREFSAAVWRPNLYAAEVVKQRKQSARDMGFMRGGKLFLHIEEAVFLVDRGDLLLFAEQGPEGRQQLVSVQEAFDLMLSQGVSMERYLLLSSLCRSGYLVVRHPARWALERGERPEQVWGSGAWAGSYGQQPELPRASTAVTHDRHQLPDLGCASTDGMDIDSGLPGGQRGPADSGGPCVKAGDTGGGGGGGGATGAGSYTSQWQARRRQKPEKGGEQGGEQQQQQQGVVQEQGQGQGQAGAKVHREWWVSAAEGHPHLSGVPRSFFEEMPPAVVEERLATSLRERFPLLRPLSALRTAMAAGGTDTTAPAALAAASNHQPAAPSVASSAPGSDGSGQPATSQPTSFPASSVPAGSTAATVSPYDVSLLGPPRQAAHLVFDVYKPGTCVSRYKKQAPPCHTHVAMCSDAPPSLVDLLAGDVAAAAAGAGEGGRPSPVTWAAVLNGDIALYTMGRADLLELM